MTAFRSLVAAATLSVFAAAPVQSEPLFRGAINEDAGDFGGLYAGANVGYGFGSASLTALPSAEADLGGVTGGGHFGYSHRIERMIFGLEVDFDAAAISYQESALGLTGTVEATWLRASAGASASCPTI